MKLEAEEGITPDCWVIIEFPDPILPGMPPYQKILSGWSGGYLDGDAWRLSSPLKKMDIKVNQDFYTIETSSGSTYTLWKSRQGLRQSISDTYNTLKQKFGDMIEIVEL